MDFPIGFLKRRATTWLAEPEPRPLATCPGCGSGLVQPQRWKELPGGDLYLQLRCPECLAVTSGTFAQRRVAEYDEALVEGKQAILADYEAVVRHNMQELVDHFKRALELDLISAADFEPGPVARPCARGPGLDGPTLQVESV